MNTDEATHILNMSGVVLGHLSDDFNDYHTKLLQTQQDINHLKTLYRRLKEIRAAAGYAEEGPDPEEVILSTSDALFSLAKTISKLESKVKCLNMSINISNAAHRTLNKFGNKIPGIPKFN